MAYILWVVSAFSQWGDWEPGGVRHLSEMQEHSMGWVLGPQTTLVGHKLPAIPTKSVPTASTRRSGNLQHVGPILSSTVGLPAYQIGYLGCQQRSAPSQHHGPFALRGDLGECNTQAGNREVQQGLEKNWESWVLGVSRGCRIIDKRTSESPQHAVTAALPSNLSTVLVLDPHKSRQINNLGLNRDETEVKSLFQGHT